MHRARWRFLLALPVLLTAAATALTAQGFTVTRQLETGPFPVDAAAADLDGDGDADLVVVHAGQGPGARRIRTVLGDGRGGFTLGPRRALAAGARQIVVGDFDGDGRTDAAVLHRDPDQITVLMGDGRGGLGPPRILPFALDRPTGLAAADLDLDGRTDLAVTDLAVTDLGGPPDGAAGPAGRLSVLTRLHLERPELRHLPLAGEARGLLAADLLGQRLPDLVLAEPASGRVTIWENTGLGLWIPTRFATGLEAPRALAAGDFDGDGLGDLVVFSGVAARMGTGGFSRGRHFRQRDGGTFEAVRTFKTGQCPLRATAADLDADGDLDLALLTAVERRCYWSHGAGLSWLYDPVRQRFDPGSTFATGHVPVAAVPADFDGDGALDLAVVNAGDAAEPASFSVWIDLQRPPPHEGALRFVDLTARLGEAPASRTLATHVYNGAAGGAVTGDFDGDGWADLYLLDDNARGDAPHRLLLSRGDAAAFEPGGDPFVEVTGHGAEAPGVSAAGALAADFNNDGRTDLYVFSGVHFGELGDCRRPDACRDLDLGELGRLENRLYINEGPGQGTDQGTAVRFRDATASAGVADLEFVEQAGGRARVDRGNARAATAADFNRDGWLDLYVGNFHQNGRLDADNSRDGMPNSLYLNQGTGADGRLRPFLEVAAAAGVLGTLLKEGEPHLSDGGSALAVMAADLDQDGWVDLYVANDMDLPDGSPLYLNDGDRDGDGAWDGTFSERATELGLDTPIRAGMGVDVGDLDLDGILDLAVSDIQIGLQGGHVGCGLFLGRPPDPATGTSPIAFEVLDHPNPIGGGFGWSMGFEDLDLDGDEDLHVTSTAQVTDMLYRNDGVDAAGRPRLVNVGGTTLGDPPTTRGVAYADFDRDGRVDLFQVTRKTGAGRLWINRTPRGGRRWLQVRARVPVADGAWRDAVGARIVVTTVLADGSRRTQQRQIQVGEGNAGSTSETVARFGLGEAVRVEAIEVRWPDGRRSVHGPFTIDRRLSLEPPP